jgi:hypothetical protein
MTLQNSNLSALYAPEPCPLSGDTKALARWAQNEFEKLQQYFRRPEVPVVVWSKLDTGADADVARPQDGMMVYASAGVIGGPEGFYVFEANTWKKIAGT